MARKKSHEEIIQKGIEELREKGVPVEETSPGLVDALKPHLNKTFESDLAAIFLMGRVADTAAVELLASLEKGAVSKEIKKEIRRSLYKLSQKGLRAPELKQPEPERAAFSLGPEIEGYLSAVDGAGGRLVWLARLQPGGGILLLQGMVSDREGLVRVGAMPTRRKEVRRIAMEIEKRHGIKMISIPWEYADQLLYEGFEKAKALGRSGLEEFSTLRAPFSAARPKALPHPVYDRLGGEDPRSGAWRELSRRLLEDAEFRAWVLDEDWVKPYLARVQEAQESRLVLNQLQKEERFASIVREAVREVFAGGNGQLFRRRMEDMALYLLETMRAREAKLALAVALALKEGDLGGIGGLEVSFLTGLVQRSLAFYLSQTKAKAEQEPSLIVKP